MAPDRDFMDADHGNILTRLREATKDMAPGEGALGTVTGPPEVVTADSAAAATEGTGIETETMTELPGARDISTIERETDPVNRLREIVFKIDPDTDDFATLSSKEVQEVFQIYAENFNRLDQVIPLSLQKEIDQRINESYSSTGFISNIMAGEITIDDMAVWDWLRESRSNGFDPDHAARLIDAYFTEWSGWIQQLKKQARNFSGYDGNAAHVEKADRLIDLIERMGRMQSVKAAFPRIEPENPRKRDFDDWLKSRRTQLGILGEEIEKRRATIQSAGELEERIDYLYNVQAKYEENTWEITRALFNGGLLNEAETKQYRSALTEIIESIEALDTEKRAALLREADQREAARGRGSFAESMRTILTTVENRYHQGYTEYGSIPGIKNKYIPQNGFELHEVQHELAEDSDFEFFEKLGIDVTPRGFLEVFRDPEHDVPP